VDEIRVKKILLVVESSEESMKAARWAIHLASVCDAMLVCLNVVDTVVVNQLRKFSGKDFSTVEVEVEEQGWKYLYYLEDAAKDRKVHCVIMQESGILSEEVVKKSEEVNADLVVMGRRTGSSMKRVVHGPIQRILEHAPCPVLVVT